MTSTSSSNKSQYHHGNLENELLETAVSLILEKGIDGFSLREVARRAGVSHSAPAHHFKDKTGLITAIATQGFQKMEAEMSLATQELANDPIQMFKEAGMSYVRFAAKHPAHFEAMFKPSFHRHDDLALINAALATRAILLNATTNISEIEGYEIDAEALALWGWSTAHGLSHLWLSGNIDPNFTDDSLKKAILSVFDHNKSFYLELFKPKD